MKRRRQKSQRNGCPGIFGEFAAALSLATETPEALSVMTVLGVLSAALMQRVVFLRKIIGGNRLIFTR